nr:MAG TPA: CW7 repeat protein [Caudoviricetes sp.]
MSFKQKIFPNLDDKKLVVYDQGKPLTSWFLWCLAVAQRAFNVTPFAESAQIAWSWNNTKHQDRNLPDGCFVPIWWTGGYKNYGHVAIAKRTGNRIQIWSSPYTRKPFFDYFEGELNATIDTVSRIYGVVYAGWTETMNTTRIVEWVNPPQLKSNEEIAAEVWQNKWGNGQDRINRLTQASYDWKVIQSLVDKGIGKPQPESSKQEEKPIEKPTEKTIEPPKQPEQPVEPPKPEPAPEEPKRNPQEKEKQMEENKTENIKKVEQKIEERENKEIEPMKPTLTDEQISKINEEYMRLANASTEAITEAGSGFEFSNKTKIVAYLIGDFLLLGSAITPQVVLAVMSLNDKNMTAFGTALASILATLGSQILLIFKLLKKK